MPRLLVPAVRLRSQKRLWLGGGPGPDARILRAAAGEELFKRGRSQEGKVSLISTGIAGTFLAREWTKAHAQKRGSGGTLLSLDETDAENRYLLEPVDTLTADKIFARRWATTLLDQAMSRLRDECVAHKKEALFREAEGLLSGEKGEAPYADIATTLNMSEGAVKVAVHRLRQRYGELVRAEIAQTVTNQHEADEELSYLFAVLRG